MQTLARLFPAAGRRLALLVVGLLAAAPLSALTVSAVANLSFGSFIAGSGGTVVVGTGGSRSKTGAVLLLSQGGVVAAAQFLVSGTADATYSITLPGDNAVALSDGNSHTMALNSFVSSPSATGMLSGGGSQLIAVGATLSVGSGQAGGSYTGSFNVTVEYQ